METIYRQLAEPARRHGAVRLVLFGSRARGDATPGSDIDLTVYGMPPKSGGLSGRRPRSCPRCSNSTSCI